jgi:hypothetical protein
LGHRFLDSVQLLEGRGPSSAQRPLDG